MFHLRDEIANEQFGGRVKDVFGNLGTGLVKTDAGPKDENQETKEIKANKRPKYSDTASEQRRASRERDEEKRDNTPVGDEKKRDDARGRHDTRDEFKKPSQNFRPKMKARSRYVPGHRKNPDKWTKYSLADVDQMSDKSNTKAALDFLSQLRKEKRGEPEEEAADLGRKVVFKRKAEREESKDDGAPEEEGGSSGGFRGGVRVMPECEVGRRKEKIDKVKKTEKSNKVHLKLSHLDDEDEED